MYGTKIYVIKLIHENRIFLIEMFYNINLNIKTKIYLPIN